MARYAYFWGCFVQGRLPYIEKSTRAVAEVLGLDIGDVEGLSCCPEKTLAKNMSHEAWLAGAARNLAVAEAAGCDFATPCPGCVGTLAGAQAEMASDRHVLAEVNGLLERVGRAYSGTVQTFHFLDVLWREFGPDGIRRRVVWPLNGLRIAVHYGCHLVRPSTDLGFDHPFNPDKFDQLVEAIGAESIEYRTKMLCCGGLLLRVNEQETAHDMARLKLVELTEQGADALVTYCPSCILQYDNVQFMLQRRGENMNVPVLCYSELLGLALGLEPEALGLSEHRVDVGPFLEALKAASAPAEGPWDQALLRKCAECGACVADCPVAQTDLDYDPNRLVRLLASRRVEDVEQVLSSSDLWKCIECYACWELCPQRYSMLDIFRAAKHLAIERKLAPPGFADAAKALVQKGRLAQVSAVHRKWLGLPPVEESGDREWVDLLKNGVKP